VVRWVSGSKARIDSSVSPKKSSRTGSAMPGANRSTMPPRMAYSPASRTVEARMKPLSSSHSVIPDMAMTLPGAAASDWRDRISRGGTRWSMALTVASRIAGRSRPLMRASRASVVMRCATTPACGDTRS
jgi:hypothetical protein